MATGSDSKHSSGSVRTFRGRTIDEILPQVRSELGPDAVILREREGLVGGVGGFFAQRFVEVDARRGDGQSIDIYDDAPDDSALPAAVALLDEPEDGLPSLGALVPEPVDLRGDRAPGTDEPPALPEPAQPERERPPAPTPPPARRFETGLFLERLREATQAPDDGDELTYRGTEAPDPEAIASGRRTAPEPEPEPEPEETEPAASRRGRAREQPTPEPETMPTPTELEGATGPEADPEPEPAPRRQRRSEPPRGRERERTNRSSRTARAKDSKPTRQPGGRRRRPEPEPEAVPEPPAVPENPYETVRPRVMAAGDGDTQSARPPAPRRAAGKPKPVSPTPAARQLPAPFATPQTEPDGVGDASSGRRTTRDGAGGHASGETLRGIFGRLLGGRPSNGSTARPASPVQLDVAEAKAAATDLSARGASDEWAAQLISAAGAHAAPLAGSLREAAAAEVARRILSAPALPATGAAIAFIGSGGSGKTRCTAALASAYRRGSTLAVTVIALDNPAGARELNRLLHDDQVPVLSLSAERAQRAIAEARSGGLVIVDTATCTPTDADAVHRLQGQLEPLGLDAVYVALPATLGPQAARRALSSFSTLKPTAVTVTHADETDQLAVVIEIATAHRIPLAYVHSGTDHRTALASIEPRDIAEHLLS